MEQAIITAVLLALVGCDRIEPKSLQWLGKEWTNPVDYGHMRVYRRAEWPGVQVIELDGHAGTWIRTEGWSNEKQVWVMHGPDLHIRTGEVLSGNWKHGQPASASDVVVVPWTNAIRVDEPDEYELAKP